MALSVVAGSAVGASSSTSISKPTSAGYTETANDLIVVMCQSSGVSGTSIPALPAGFTQITHVNTGNGGDSAIWGYKLDSGSESWPKSFTAATGSGFNVWNCIVLRGNDTSTPTDGTATTDFTVTGTTLSLAAITATVAGDTLVIMLVDDGDVDVSVWPTGVTEYADSSNPSGNGVVAGTKASMASGSTGTLGVTMHASPSVTMACAFLIKPASGGSTTNFSATADTLTGSDSVGMVATGAQTDPTPNASETAGLEGGSNLNEISLTAAESQNGGSTVGLSDNLAAVDSNAGVATASLTEIALATAESAGGTGSNTPANDSVAVSDSVVLLDAPILQATDSVNVSDNFTLAASSADTEQLTVSEMRTGVATLAFTEISLTVLESQSGGATGALSDSLATAESLAGAATESEPAESVTVSDSIGLTPQGPGNFQPPADTLIVSDSFTLIGADAISEGASLNDTGGGTGTITFGTDSLATSDSVALQSGGVNSFVATDTLTTTDSFTLTAADALLDPALASSDSAGGTSSLAVAEVLAEAEAILFQWGAHLTPDTLTLGAESVSSSGGLGPSDSLTHQETYTFAASTGFAVQSVAVLDSITVLSVIPSSLLNAVLLIQSAAGVSTAISSNVGHGQIIQSAAGGASLLVPGPEGG